MSFAWICRTFSPGTVAVSLLQLAYMCFASCLALQKVLSHIANPEWLATPVQFQGSLNCEPYEGKHIITIHHPPHNFIKLHCKELLVMC